MGTQLYCRNKFLTALAVLGIVALVCFSGASSNVTDETPFVANSTSNSLLKPFDYKKQVGLVHANAEGHPTLYIQNQNLPEGTSVQLVFFEEMKPPINAYIQKKIKPAADDFNHEPEDTVYVLRISGQPLESNITGIGVTGFNGEFHVKKDGPQADFNGDKQLDAFRVCNSMEGLHLTLWSGPALKSYLQWHRYKYLGYELSEATCTEKDYEEQ